MKNALVILAGGKGERFGQKTPKQFYEIRGNTIINIFLASLQIKNFSKIVISISTKYSNLVKNTDFYKLNKSNIIFSKPGMNRQKSSFNALKKIQKYKLTNVLIHDAARPFCSNILIKKILKKLKNNNNCIPFIEYSDRQIIKSNRRA